MERILPRPDRQQSTNTRTLFALSGGLLLLYGLKHRSFLGGLLAVAGVDLMAKGLLGHHVPAAFGIPDPAPGRRGQPIPYQLGVQMRKSICVGVSREKAYSFVRDLQTMPKYMKHVKSVTPLADQRSHWIAEGPGGTPIEWNAALISDIPGELIAWKSEPGADVDSAGSIRFSEAGQDRGTLIRVSMQYMPPAGTLGAVIARLFGKDPTWDLSQDLRRLKQILETGEVSTIEGQSRGPKYPTPVSIEAQHRAGQNRDDQPPTGKPEEQSLRARGTTA
jgi:uncharacterized membrane protein